VLSTHSKYQEEWLHEGQMAEWDAFVATSLEGNPFSTSAWLRAFRLACSSGSTRVLVLRNKTGEVAAGVGLCAAKNRLGQEKAITPGLHQYASFLYARSKTSEPDRIIGSRLELGARLAEIVEGCGFESARLVHHPHVTDVRALMWRNWQVRPAYTFHVDLNTFYDENSFSSSQRKRCRQGREQGYSFIESDAIPCKSNLLSLLEDTFRRQQLDLQWLDPYFGGLQGYSSYLDSLGNEAGLKCFQTVHPSLGVGAMRAGVLGSDGTFYDWIAGNESSQLQLGCSAFTILSLLKTLKDSGVTTFDFGGANTPGVADFKQTFNGRLVVAYETLWKSPKLKHRTARVLGRLSHRARTAAKSLFRPSQKPQD